MCADRIRIVLGHDVEEKDYAPLLVRHQWVDQRRRPRKDDQNREFVYSTEDKANYIHYVEDHKLDAKYMLVIGPQAQQIEQILRDGVINWTSDMILERSRESDLSQEDRREVLYHLALDNMERGFNQEVFDIYSKALGDSDPLIRSAAVLGASYLSWTELAKPLRSLAADAGADQAIRDDAARLVEQLDAQASSN